MEMKRNIASVLVMCMVVGAALVPLGAEGTVTCSQVRVNMIPCLGYLRSGGSVPMPCCRGVNALNGLAKSTPDRQDACRCLQTAATQISGIIPAYATSLPSKCGVNIPYKIAPSTDCSKVR